MEGLWGASLPFLMLHSNLKISGVWDLCFHWNCPNSNPWAWQNMSRLLLVETVLYLFKIQSQKSVFSSLPLKIHCCQSLQKATSCVWRPILGILLLNRECFLLKWTLWGRCSCPSSNLDDVFITIHLKKMAANKSRSFSHSLELEISDPQTLWKLQVLFEISDLLFQVLPASVLLEIPTWALPAVHRVSGCSVQGHHSEAAPRVPLTHNPAEYAVPYNLLVICGGQNQIFPFVEFQGSSGKWSILFWKTEEIILLSWQLVS